jgi:hypothetical protein
MKRYIILALAALSISCSGALRGWTHGDSPQQWGNLGVVITDATTHQPIAGVRITIANGGDTVTDEHGEAVVRVTWQAKDVLHDALGDFVRFTLLASKARYISVSNQQGGVDGEALFLIARPALTTRATISMTRTTNPSSREE